jgi:cyclopropane fatty-acyl-phospholipid synthase-like methyltransferase
MANLRTLFSRARIIVKTEGYASLASEFGRFLKTQVLHILSNYEATRDIYYRLFDPEAYWERRYSTGGSAGPGSTGQHAQFKANFINTFVENRDVETVIEFGCGDGDQISLGNYPEYIGLEVSKSAVERCAKRFDDDPTKSFFLYSPQHFINRGAFTADLALSLEVIFHILSDDEYEAIHL